VPGHAMGRKTNLTQGVAPSDAGISFSVGGAHRVFLGKFVFLEI
jgi:hypothetical protein